MSAYNELNTIIRLRRLTTPQEGSILLREGAIWYNTTLKALRLRINNATITLANLADVPLPVAPDSSNLGEVADEAEMLALVGDVGDYAYRTDEDKFYIINALPTTDVLNWSILATDVATVDLNYRNGLTKTGSDVDLGGDTASTVQIIPTGNDIDFILGKDYEEIDSPILFRMIEEWSVNRKIYLDQQGNLDILYNSGSGTSLRFRFTATQATFYRKIQYNAVDETTPDDADLVSWGKVKSLLNVSSVVIQNPDGTYPALTPEQQALNVVFWRGYNYPPNFRENDEWIIRPASVVQTAITDLLSTSFLVNWNPPMKLNRSQVSVPAEVLGYIVQVSTASNFNTIVYEHETTALSDLVTGLTPNTEYFVRVLNGVFEDAYYTPSNSISVTTPQVSTIFGTALTFNPQYAFDYRPIDVLAASVLNQGTEVGVNVVKSAGVGDFTKNIGLVSTANNAGRLRHSIGNLELGHSAVGGVDWVLLFAMVSNNVSANQQVSLYGANRNTNRMRVSATGIVNQLTFATTVLAGTTIPSLGLGTVGGARVTMILKTGDTIRRFNKGSITPVGTYNMVADQSIQPTELVWFENNNQFSFADIEAIYSVFAHGASVTNNEQALIDMMLLADN